MEPHGLGNYGTIAGDEVCEVQEPGAIEPCFGSVKINSRSLDVVE